MGGETMQDMPPGEAEISATVYISALHGPKEPQITTFHARFPLGLGKLGS